MDSVNFVLELYGQCGYWNCMESMYFVLELHGQCEFCFGTV